MSKLSKLWNNSAILTFKNDKHFNPFPIYFIYHTFLHDKILPKGHFYDMKCCPINLVNFWEDWSSYRNRFFIWIHRPLFGPAIAHLPQFMAESESRAIVFLGRRLWYNPFRQRFTALTCDRNRFEHVPTSR